MSKKQRTNFYPETIEGFSTLEQQKQFHWKSLDIIKGVYEDSTEGIVYKKRKLPLLTIDQSDRYQRRHQNDLKGMGLCKVLNIRAPVRFSGVCHIEPTSVLSGGPDDVELTFYTAMEKLRGKTVGDFINDRHISRELRDHVKESAPYEQAKVALLLGDGDRARNSENTLVTYQQGKIDYGHIDFEWALSPGNDEIEAFFYTTRGRTERQTMFGHYIEAKETLLLAKANLPTDFYYDSLQRMKKADLFIKTSPVFSGPPL